MHSTLLALTACVATATIVPQPGVVIGETDETGDPGPPDADGDGFPDDEDCAPNDPEINPGAEERCDPVDWNCDGVGWTDEDCPCDVQVYNGVDAFYVACRDRTTWTEARQICDDADLHLAIVDDEAENLRVQTLLAQVSSSSGWIGLSDLADEGFFVWVDGSALSFRNWAPTHPLASDRLGREVDCVSLGLRNGFWFAQYCEAEHAFVCEAR